MQVNSTQALQDIRSEINVTLFEKMGEAALEVLQPRSLSFEDQGKFFLHKDDRIRYNLNIIECSNRFL